LDAIFARIKSQVAKLGKPEDVLKDLKAKLDPKGEGFVTIADFDNGVQAAKFILTYMELHSLHRFFDPENKNQFSVEGFFSGLAPEAPAPAQ
jgi:hypothetical protein